VVTDISGNAPILDTLKRTTADVAATRDQEAFRTLYMNLFHKTRYSLYRILLQREFIGKSLVPLATLQANLQKVKQIKIRRLVRSSTTRSRSTTTVCVTFFLLIIDLTQRKQKRHRTRITST
jgi:hypothetical protein